MPLDAVLLCAIHEELEHALLNTRIDKIQQPSRDTVILQFRAKNGGSRLIFGLSPGRSRVHLTQISLENPAQPPMFCMLLRKHLSGSRVCAITQPSMERLLDFTLDCVSELGEPTQKHLIAEVMGCTANLILCGADGRIIDCLRRVDFEMSEKRQLLPGLYYHRPPALLKIDPRGQSAADLLCLISKIDAPIRPNEWLLQTFSGLSPLICREIMYDAGLSDEDLRTLPKARCAQLATVSAAAFSDIAARRYKPVLLMKNGQPFDYCYREIRQYGDYIATRCCESFSQMLDQFYGERERTDRIRQKTQAMRKTLTNLRDRSARKLEMQRKELEGARDRERLRQLGDIVTANLHRMTRGDSRLLAEDFYTPEQKMIEISLMPTLTPQQNAAKYYKEYAKAKTAERVLTEQIKMGETERSYLESVLDELDRAEREQDISEIRVELVEGGYLRDTEKRRKKLLPSAPMQFISSAGVPIYVGRNNRQNDWLTCKQALKHDLWLHAGKVSGSHVIVECRGVELDDHTVEEAAMLAAWFSQARAGHKVPVDYTLIRNVKKPVGAKPGMVVYEHYKTIYVIPDKTLEVQLSKTTEG